MTNTLFLFQVKTAFRLQTKNTLDDIQDEHTYIKTGGDPRSTGGH